jgi:hypothetical protein
MTLGRPSHPRGREVRHFERHEHPYRGERPHPPHQGWRPPPPHPGYGPGPGWSGPVVEPPPLPIDGGLYPPYPSGAAPTCTAWGHPEPMNPDIDFIGKRVLAASGGQPTVAQHHGRPHLFSYENGVIRAQPCVSFGVSDMQSEMQGSTDTFKPEPAGQGIKSMELPGWLQAPPTHSGGSGGSAFARSGSVPATPPTTVTTAPRPVPVSSITAPPVTHATPVPVQPVTHPILPATRAVPASPAIQPQRPVQRANTPVVRPRPASFRPAPPSTWRPAAPTPASWTPPSPMPDTWRPSPPVGVPDYDRWRRDEWRHEEWRREQWADQQWAAQQQAQMPYIQVQAGAPASAAVTTGMYYLYKLDPTAGWQPVVSNWMSYANVQQAMTDPNASYAAYDQSMTWTPMQSPQATQAAAAPSDGSTTQSDDGSLSGAGGDRLNGMEYLSAGQSLFSPNGQYHLDMQSDGNLVLYSGGGNSPSQAVWSPNTQGKGGAYAVMQGDGNFVIVRQDHHPVWATGTNGQQGLHARIHDDGTFAIQRGETRVKSFPS